MKNKKSKLRNYLNFIRQTASGFIFCILIFEFAGVMGCEQTTAQRPHETRVTSHQSRGTDKPPLLLDDEPLLQLEDSQDSWLLADNSRCHVCHVNYMQENIAVVHARASIGCKDCHGQSDAHIADESWAWGGNGTPPDIMYSRAEINPVCFGCHAKDKFNAEQHNLVFAGTAERKYCTDCHGSHRLAQRKCKWK